MGRQPKASCEHWSFTLGWNQKVQSSAEFRLHGTRRNVKNGCCMCLSSKSNVETLWVCQQICEPTHWQDDKQKRPKHLRFFVCLFLFLAYISLSRLTPTPYISSMIWEEGKQPIWGGTDEGLPWEAVSIGIQVSRQGSPKSDVTSWLLLIIRNSQWSGTALTAGHSPAAFSCKTWANMNWMNKLLDGLKISWTKN